MNKGEKIKKFILLVCLTLCFTKKISLVAFITKFTYRVTNRNNYPFTKNI